MSSYRYPDVLPATLCIPVRLSGREVVYRVHVRRRIANFGVAVVKRASGVRVEPRVVRAGDENRVAGYTGLPFDQNPYRSGYGRHRLVVGVVLPVPGSTTSSSIRLPAHGPERSAFGSGRATSGRRPSGCSAFGTDSSSLRSLTAAPGWTHIATGADRRRLRPRLVCVRSRAPLFGRQRTRPTHAELTASDYQETKNMENVARILPNTRTVRTTFVRP